MVGGAGSLGKQGLVTAPVLVAMGGGKVWTCEDRQTAEPQAPRPRRGWG